jgi:acetolactate synthase-1/2/3 large subunit
VAIVGLGALAHPDAARRHLVRLGWPVLCTYQATGVVDGESDQAAGLFTNGASERPLLDQADLVVTVGLDPVEPIPAPWRCAAPVLSLQPGPLDEAYTAPAVSLHGPLGDLLDGVLAGAPTGTWPAGAGAAQRERTRAELRDHRSGGFGPLDVVDAVVAAAPAGTTATVDAGAHFLAVLPLWPAHGPLSLLISNGRATMGFALPAAVGAALARPGRPVACFVGDGGLAMGLGELETLARLDLPVTVVVLDDAALSLIAIKQRPGQGGEAAVRFRPVDYAAVARAAGLAAATAGSADELAAALDGGWDRPRLVDARIDPASYGHLLRVTRG